MNAMGYGDLDSALMEIQRQAARVLDFIRSHAYDAMFPEQVMQQMEEGIFPIAEFLRTYDDFLTSRGPLDGRHIKIAELAVGRPDIVSMLPLPDRSGVQVNLRSPIYNTSAMQDIYEDDESSGTEISVDVYIDTDDEKTHRRIFRNVDDLVSLLGYGGPEDEEVIRGSIFRRSRSRLKQAITSDEMKLRAAKAERALEIQGLDGPQADVYLKISQAISNIIHSVSETQSSVCLRVGPIFLVKYQTAAGPVVLTRSLSQIELKALERYPEIQRDPIRAFELLAMAVESWDDGHDHPFDDGGRPEEPRLL